MSGKQADKQTSEATDSDPDGETDTNVRDRLLQGLGGLGAAGLAGCLGGEGEDPDENNETDDNETDTDDDTDDTDADDDTDTDDDTDDGTGTADGWHRDHDFEADADAATDWDNYEVTELEAIENLMSMDVDHEGRVWYITRGGNFPEYGDSTCEVGWIDPEEGESTVALELDVVLGSVPKDWGVEEWGELDLGGDEENGDEEENGEEEEAGPPEMAARELGGQAVALDPDFEENGYVYVTYHPSTDNDEEVENPYHEDIATYNRPVSRFEMQDDGTLDPDSEEVIINLPYQRTTCCHRGHYLTFGPEGCLYITTGDNSNNVGNPDEEIDWFMGDEREGYVHGRPAAVSDAQRTSGNTADLRGSVLRIVPTDDGDYEVPDDNLKFKHEEETGEEYDQEEFRPEIYVLGCRNPYVVHVDDHTGNLFVADYGNDATSSDPELGPLGMATYSLWCEAGQNGWPYFKGFYPYRDYDYEAGEPGQPFWPDNLRNESPNNTGIVDVPDYTMPHLAWHPQSWDEYVTAEEFPWLDMPRPSEITFPELPEGGSANAGIAYRYSEDFGEGALDPYFEGKQFFMTPFAGGGMIGTFTFNEDGSIEIEEFLPDHEMEAPTDMGVLPDGRIVIMAYGGFSGEGGGLYLVEYDG